MEKSYIRAENENILKENIIIHWWNFGKKTLDFNGTVQEYLNKNKVAYLYLKNEDLR